MGVPPLLPFPRHSSLSPSYAPRGASIPCALSPLRILPVTTGVWGLPALLATRHSSLATFLPSGGSRRRLPVPQMPLRNLPTSGTVLAFSGRARRVQRTVVYGASA